MGNVIVACGLQTTRIKDDKEDAWAALWRAGVSEFFATMIFIFIGTGSVEAAQTALGNSGIKIPSLTLISIAHGFTIMVMIYAIGELSGGHINPAVTWAVLITDRISILRALIYWFAQFSGAIVGSAFLKSILPPSLQFGMGCHGVNNLIDPYQALGLEITFTFIFIFVVFSTAISPFAGKLSPLGGGDYGPGKLTPFAVGMTILILHTVGIPLTGASMNPARSFGPAVVVGCWKDHWVYWFGPIIGSTLAAVIAQLIFLSSPGDIKTMLTVTRGVNLLGVTNAIKAGGQLEVDEEMPEHKKESREDKDGLVQIRL